MEGSKRRNQTFVTQDDMIMEQTSKVVKSCSVNYFARGIVEAG